MINAEEFLTILTQERIEFFTGVPDSLLKHFLTAVKGRIAPLRHIISVNEGNAVALASGYHLATGKIPLIYLQNSGLGNAINPLTSLTDSEVYKIPVLLVVGWRGQPGKPDEPQHVKMGKTTLDLLRSLDIPFFVLPRELEEARGTVKQILNIISESSSPAALVIEEDTFSPIPPKVTSGSYPMSRESGLGIVLESLSADCICVSTTGKLSRELFEYRKNHNSTHAQDFLSIGSMGHVSQIALGVALMTPERPVYCLDGDGSLLMHMGGMSVIAALKPSNYFHIVFNNGVHDSVGGQPTVGFVTNFIGVAKSVGYRMAKRVDSELSLRDALNEMNSSSGPFFLEIRISLQSRSNLGRPDISPFQNKTNFMRCLAKKV